MEYDPKKVICSCARVTCGDMADAVKAGAKTVSDIRERTRATAFCGSCTDRVEGFLNDLLSGEAVPAPQEPAAADTDEHPAPLYREVCQDIYMVGGSDRRLERFENQYPIPRGVSYNSYLLMDDKNVLLDTVDHAVEDLFFRNLETLLRGKKLDYVVVNHMEPDHCSALGRVLARWPESQVITTPGAKKMIAQFFGPDFQDRVQEVRDGVSVMTGKHILSFHTAPMVHWPEVMVTYDRFSETLFSADAFGTFGALDGNLFADQVDFERDWMDDARRYYTNIVGKYGAQVQALLKKAAGLTIHRICPLHGPIWRRDLGLFLDKYQKWSTYTPEKQGVLIAYASVYGHTEQTCQALANALSIQGVRDVRMYDVSKTDVSEILSEAFCRSHLVLASVTYNGEIFPAMEHLIRELRAHGLKNRKVALVENGTWAPVAGRKMAALLEGSGMEILPGTVTVRSQLTRGQLGQIDALAKAIADTLE